MARRTLPALRVQQWLEEWDKVPLDAARFQSAPPREFYMASISAADLRALAGVYPRRSIVDATKPERYVQRTLDPDRADEIEKYVRLGYPLSGIKRKLAGEERDQLRKPGWLPTAVVANLIPTGESREQYKLAASDAMKIDIEPEGRVGELVFPTSWTARGWEPSKGSVPPLEIIDGQHRLSAFDNQEIDDFELPVVIFVGLDFSWQAYLFWTINIKPKRINASLAYDLYPLLREQDWLEAGEGLNIYRETRAQELVEALWTNPQSIWFDRINMLGQNKVRNDKPVTQSAFIGSLTSSFVRVFRGYRGLGGLFGGGQDGSGLQWPRSQQAAVLINLWKTFGEAVATGSWDWTESLRGTLLDDSDEEMWADRAPTHDPALVGPHTLIASDPGVRAFHIVANDLLYLAREQLQLSAWRPSDEVLEDEGALNLLIAEMDPLPIGSFLRALAVALASFDWRSSQASDLTKEERELRLAVRGSGGYNVLRDRLLIHLEGAQDPNVRRYATQVIEARGLAR